MQQPVQQVQRRRAVLLRRRQLEGGGQHCVIAQVQGLSRPPGGVAKALGPLPVSLCLTVPWDLSASPLYRHLATKEAAGEAQSVLLEPLLDQVEADPDCAFLREMPEYGTMVEKYRRAADGA